jgi:enediyne biosynthesis protein E4
MSKPSPSRLPWLLGGAVVVLAAGLAVFLLTRGGSGPVQPPPATGADPAAADRPGFHERATESGITWRMAFLPAEQGENFKINLYDHGCGVAIGDYNGDGHDDIYFVNQLGPNALYRNKGDGTFVEVAKEAGVALGDRICVAATFADYDNDGRQDLFVTSTRGGNVLFRNMGDGTFKDVTKEVGLTCVAHSQTAVFFDYDNDGYLDLFVTNTAKWTTGSFDAGSHYFPGLTDFWEMAASPKEHNILYHNNGNGTFTDVTAKAGLEGKGWGGDVAVFDFDGDGHLDLLVTNMFGASQLYHNNGDGTFTDVTREWLGRTSWGAIGSKVFDFNNDGLLDLFIADMHSDMWLPTYDDPAVLEMVKKSAKKKFRHVMGPYATMPQYEPTEKRFADMFQIKYDDVIFGNTFFKRLPQGKFEEVSDKAGLETFWPWGIATGDFDNDGFEDVYLPSGMGFPYHYWPSSLLMNNGNETFTDRAEVFGIEPPPRGPFLPDKIAGKPAARSSRCAAVADFDGDGRLDLVTNNFNDQPYYFRNAFPRKHYVAFRLKGTRSNRDAIGALVHIYMAKEVMVRQVQAAGGYLSQSSKTVHFGLGDRPAIDRVEIRWPSGVRQRIDHPEVDHLHDVTEPEK